MITFYGCDKIPQQTATWERKDLFGLQLTVHHQRKPKPEGSQDRNLEQELKPMPWTNDAYWLALPSLLSLLSHTY